MSLFELQPQVQFQPVTDQLLAQKHVKVQKKNMVKNDKAAEKQCREYLNVQDCDHTRFWEFCKEDLDKHLSHFWFAARHNKIDKKTNEPKKYRVQTLKTLQYVLNRVLHEHGITFDIITDSDFRKSQTAFTDCCKELKKEGYGFITPTDEITPEGMSILHGNFTIFAACSIMSTITFPSSCLLLVKMNVNIGATCTSANHRPDALKQQQF